MKFSLISLIFSSIFSPQLAVATSYGGDLARDVILAAREAAPLPLNFSSDRTLATLPETRFDCAPVPIQDQDLSNPNYGLEQFECFADNSSTPLARAASRNLYMTIGRVFPLNRGEPVSVIMRSWGLRLSESAPANRFYCVAERL
jgi:hypothetical protein